MTKIKDKCEQCKGTGYIECDTDRGTQAIKCDCELENIEERERIIGIVKGRIKILKERIEIVKQRLPEPELLERCESRLNARIGALEDIIKEIKH